MNRFKKYLSAEIGIEYKACLYFFAIGFYYCVYQLGVGRTEASILHLAEMILATYVMCYVQVYLLRNFDEGEHFGLFEGVAALVCTLLYGLLSWFLGWFDHQIGVVIGFLCYMYFAYVCMFLVNKVKRDIDTKNLNNELDEFKKRRGASQDGE